MDEVTSLRKRRLQRLIDSSYDGNQKKLASATGLSEGRITQLLSQNESFGERAARNLATKLGLEDRYFETDEDIPPKRAEELAVRIREYATGGRMGHAGLVLRDQPGEIRGWEVTTEWLRRNVPNCTSHKNLAIVTGFGDSMRPLFNPGDPLLIDTGVVSVEFDAIYFFRVGDEGFIKRLQRIPGNGLVAISENTSYRDWTITPDMDFQVFGRVVKIWKGDDF